MEGEIAKERMEVGEKRVGRTRKMKGGSRWEGKQESKREDGKVVRSEGWDQGNRGEARREKRGDRWAERLGSKEKHGGRKNGGGEKKRREARGRGQEEVRAEARKEVRRRDQEEVKAQARKEVRGRN